MSPLTKIDFDQFTDIAFTTRAACVVCDSPCEEAVIDLPRFPLTEIFVEEKIDYGLGLVDQKFHLCNICGHGQLAHLIDKNILYGHCYRTRTSVSPSAIGALDVFRIFIDKILGNHKVKTLLEIGCNDLYFLQKLRDKADILYGIDPILKDQDQTDDKIKLIGDFFENVDLQAAGIRADIILSSHTFEHVERPAELLEKLLASASDDALFFFQFPGLESLVRDARFDQMFHQHLNYFSESSIGYLLKKLGAEVIDIQVNPYHWGALMIAFRKKKNPVNSVGAPAVSANSVKRQYQVFKNGMTVTSDRLAALDNESLYGFGAALMMPVLDYYLNGLRRIKYIIDDDKHKENLFYLNFPVQIKGTQQIKNIKDAVIVLTAIYSLTAQRAILKKLIDMKIKQIILPINLV